MHRMNLTPARSTQFRAGLIALAILLGTLIGMFAVSGGPLPWRAGGRFFFGVAAAAAISVVLIGLDLVLQKFAAELGNSRDTDLLETILEHIPECVSFKDRNGRFVRISRTMANHCGLENPGKAVGKTSADIFGSRNTGKIPAEERKVLETGQPIMDREEKQVWPDGSETWAVTTTVPLKDREGNAFGTMRIARSITDRKRAEQEIQQISLHDALTGLPNRILLEDRLTQAIALAIRKEKRVGVLMLDLDQFKNINDSFGHSAGDQVIEQVAQRLKSCLRKSDTIARMGGDEFVIALSMVDDLDGIERATQRLLETFAAPFRVANCDLQVSASVGICQFPEDGRSAPDLVQLADTAMYEAKKRGRGKYCFFSPDLAETARYRQNIENELSVASVRDQFELHYQPIIDTVSNRISAVEALLRWRHPVMGLLSPGQFIPQLEKMGMMVGIGRWTLMTACRQAADWQRLGLPSIRMAVNVSAQQFYHGNIVDTVESILAETNLDARLLELELTESQSFDESKGTISIMQALKRLGVSLSLDDFGTGWSSLSYLPKFPVDRIKIDRSFFHEGAAGPAAEAVLKSILELARHLGFQCVAEGVETIKERDYLKKLRCAEMQGFYFAMPLTAVDATAFLRAGVSQPRQSVIPSLNQTRG